MKIKFRFLAALILVALLTSLLLSLPNPSKLHLMNSEVATEGNLSCLVASQWTQSFQIDRITQQPLMRCAPYLKCAGPFSSIRNITPEVSLDLPGTEVEKLKCNQVGTMRMRVTHVVEYHNQFFLIQYAYFGSSKKPPQPYYRWEQSVKYRGIQLLGEDKANGSRFESAVQN